MTDFAVTIANLVRSDHCVCRDRATNDLISFLLVCLQMLRSNAAISVPALLVQSASRSKVPASAGGCVIVGLYSWDCNIGTRRAVTCHDTCHCIQAHFSCLAFPNGLLFAVRLSRLIDGVSVCFSQAGGRLGAASAEVHAADSLAYWITSHR